MFQRLKLNSHGVFTGIWNMPLVMTDSILCSLNQLNPITVLPFMI